MTGPRHLECPWCSHASADRRTFLTHLMVEHRKSDIVEFVVDSRASSDRGEDGTERAAN